MALDTEALPVWLRDLLQGEAVIPSEGMRQLVAWEGNRNQAADRAFRRQCEREGRNPRSISSSASQFYKRAERRDMTTMAPRCIKCCGRPWMMFLAESCFARSKYWKRDCASLAYRDFCFSYTPGKTSRTPHEGSAASAYQRRRLLSVCHGLDLPRQRELAYYMSIASEHRLTEDLLPRIRAHILVDNMEVEN